MSHRDDERALDQALMQRFAADEGAPAVAERDLDLGEFTIRTLSNRAFDFADPRPEMVVYADLIAGLAGEPRYASQTPRRYSVAEHSVLALRVAEVLEPGLAPARAFAVLMHDAAEAYCKDIPGPLKRLIGEPYRKIERAVEAAIFARFGVDFEPARKLAKEADRLAYLIERRVLFGWQDVALPGEVGARVEAALRPGVRVFSDDSLSDDSLEEALPLRSGPSTSPRWAFDTAFNALVKGRR